MEEKSMQSLGGEARANALTPEQRSEIAREGAAARWNIPKATHSGILNIAGNELECAVLQDGTRVFTRIGFLKAIGRTGKAKGGRKYDREFSTPVFLTADNLKPFITKELIENSTPVPFKPFKGGKALGYKADLLPLVCNVFLDALEANKLQPNQKHIAQQCKILLRGFAAVGINALVDEATGYQEVRDRLALQKILALYISKELLKWTKTFPDDFYEHLFKLKGWQWESLSSKRPPVVGHYTNDIVYERLAPKVLEELRQLNPPDEAGHRKNKHFQWLTPSFGHPKLRDHLNGVIALMKVATTWNEFKRMVNKVFPKFNANLELDLDV